ncbi:MAG TPA: DUF2254 family protein [Polyangiaceae bacterium]
MNRLRAYWWAVTGSLWFLPSLMVAGAILLAVGLVELDVVMQFELDQHWPRLFGAAPDGARGMLTAIAGSMITVAGVVFSVTIVALSLAASQYSPRVLRTFISDRPTQLVLGVFVAIFAYCLVVLRTIRGGDGTFVPSLAVLGGLILAMLGIAFLVYFIHHLADSIQASSIVARITSSTLGAIDQLFPENLGAPADEVEDEAEGQAHQPRMLLAARSTGYVIHVSNTGLLDFARERGRVVRMEVAIGDFVVEGQPLAYLHGSESVSEIDERALNACYTFAAQRTIHQDATFGVQQIVDIGCKALSPGINDASTALLCIDRLTQLLIRVARRRIETPFRREEGRLRVIARGPSFESLSDLAYHAIRNDARGNWTVLSHILWSMEQVGSATASPARRRVLAEQVRRVAESAELATSSLEERRQLVERAQRLQIELRGPLGELQSPLGEAG